MAKKSMSDIVGKGSLSLKNESLPKKGVTINLTFECISIFERMLFETRSKTRPGTEVFNKSTLMEQLIRDEAKRRQL